MSVLLAFLLSAAFTHQVDTSVSQLDASNHRITAMSRAAHVVKHKDAPAVDCAESEPCELAPQSSEAVSEKVQLLDNANEAALVLASNRMAVAECFQGDQRFCKVEWTFDSTNLADAHYFMGLFYLNAMYCSPISNTTNSRCQTAFKSLRKTGVTPAYVVLTRGK